MADCENLAKCSFFNEFRGNSEVIKAGWINLFCKNHEKSEQCKRKALRRTGQSPPANMTPLGNLLGHA